METTGEFIPVSSDLERQTAEKLVQEGRNFNKPPRFDASTDLVFPDFELLDTGHEKGFPMEVFGRNDEPYQARKREKEEYYKATYGCDGWWHWIANGPGKTAMPKFPPASRRPVTA